ncbi:DEAD/DEAH box helicase family protein [bacterium]|nr:DEAD/DEAH box helicase family protein [bacterium]
MNLKELNLKPVYYSDEVTLLTEFYIPVLSKSIKYDRVAGYFCSNALAIAAKGIAELIKNGGKVRLIANVVISEKDQEVIKKAIKDKEQKILIEFDELEDELQKDHIKLLGWMIKEGLLEIKIAVVNKGIEHQKIGILEDNECNIVCFSGSENETIGGWLNNDEQFHVFCSWKEGDLAHLRPDINRFNTLWEDKGKKVRVYSVSEAFNLGLIKKAPKNHEEFTRVTKEIAQELVRRKEIEDLTTTKKIKEIVLRDYQLDAMKKFTDNNSQGIFEMATGTGKTYTALGCVKELNKEIRDLVVVISCPYTHLVQQWLENVQDFDLDFEMVVADSSNSKWKSELMDRIYDIKNKVLNKLMILTTHTTFAMPDFINRMKNIQYPVFLICDEVHGIGSPERRKGLIENLYKYRLGLSATPSRWFDDEGTRIIMDFFKGTVYEFSLKEAINTVNPATRRTFLVKYDYKPLFVKLSESELQEYEEQTKKIARSFFVTKDNKEKEELFNLLCIKRQKIIINSRGKYEIFKDLLTKLIPIKDCLVYVSPEQMNHVQSIISEFDVKQHKFTSKEGIKSEDKYGGLSERNFLLKEFEKGNYNILVAMKCLDEGVDIRSAKTAIILASTGNPKEYIQRRGRILRPFPNKDKAIIYDFIVVPSIKKIDLKELQDIEIKIFDKEMKRYKEFADSADNKVECLKKVINFEKEIFEEVI